MAEAVNKNNKKIEKEIDRTCPYRLSKVRSSQLGFRLINLYEIKKK